MAISRIDRKVGSRNDGFLKAASPSPSRPPVSCHLRRSVVNAGVFWKGRGFSRTVPPVLCERQGPWGDAVGRLAVPPWKSAPRVLANSRQPRRADGPSVLRLHLPPGSPAAPRPHAGRGHLRTQAERAAPPVAVTSGLSESEIAGRAAFARRHCRPEGDAHAVTHLSTRRAGNVRS